MSKAIGSGYEKISQRDVQDAAPVEVVVNANGNTKRPWHYGLFTVCGEMNSCLECWCCLHCQISRQYNMLYHQNPELHLPVCLLVTLLDACGVPAAFALEYVLRSDMRRRYGIDGHVVEDCCFAWLCLPCAVQQQFLEMTSVGSCPGMSMCGVSPTASSETYMI